MPRGYGFFTFGWKQAERESNQINSFNERWQRLVKIHEHINQEFVEPLNSVSLTNHEFSKLEEYVDDAYSWNSAIARDINDANQNHLSRYATSIKKLSIKSIGLCKKNELYNDLNGVEYVAQRKMILINGEDAFYLGN